MRLIVLTLLAALIAQSASAREVGGLQQFRFGMSVEAVHALDDSVAWTENTGAPRFALTRFETLEVAGQTFSPQLLFDDDRLLAVVALRGATNVSSHEACEQRLSSIITALEEEYGVFAGPADSYEYGAAGGVRQTAGGSEIRSYVFTSFNMRQSIATMREGGFVLARATASPDRAPRAVDAPVSCYFDLEFRAEAPESFAPLTPPSMEALSRAPQQEASQWIRRASMEEFVRAMPPTLAYVDAALTTLACLVIEDSALNCVVVEETPPHFYLGPAMLNVSRHFRLPESVNGVPTRGRLVMLPTPMNFAAQRSALARDPSEFARLLDQAPTQEEIDAAEGLETVEWAERPSGQDFSNYFPVNALNLYQEGRVLLDCLIVAGGGVRCRVASETPVGWDFGLAALGISQSFRVGETLNGEDRVGKRVRIPIVFRLR